MACFLFARLCTQVFSRACLRNSVLCNCGELIHTRSPGATTRSLIAQMLTSIVATIIPFRSATKPELPNLEMLRWVVLCLDAVKFHQPLRYRLGRDVVMLPRGHRRSGEPHQELAATGDQPRTVPDVGESIRN
jgi:hypothetical protein